MAKSRPIPGPQAFQEWYGQMHGPRWSDLAQACEAQNRHFALRAGLLKPYFLDPASVAAALCLEVGPGMSVLDLCAAPGGKSLVLAQRLFGLVPVSAGMPELGELVEPSGEDSIRESMGESESAGDYGDGPAAPAGNPVGNQAGSPTETIAGDPETFGGDESAAAFLVVNERSANRRSRLRQVLTSHLPEQVHSRLRVTGFDATTWGQHEEGRYQRILLDIPCSSERHLIQAPQWLKDWSPRRTTQLAQQAYVMGLSAGRALAPGGKMLFATCALSDLENDQAVERILDRSAAQETRFGYRLESRRPTLPALLPGMEVEATAFGCRIWPDRGGYGPLYFALISKT